MSDYFEGMKIISTYITKEVVADGYLVKVDQNKMDITLNESWLNGKYSCGVINTSLGTIEVFDQEEGFSHNMNCLVDYFRNPSHMDQRGFNYRTDFPTMDFIKLLIAMQSNSTNVMSIY